MGDAPPPWIRPYLHLLLQYILITSPLAILPNVLQIGLVTKKKKGYEIVIILSTCPILVGFWPAVLDSSFRIVSNF